MISVLVWGVIYAPPAMYLIATAAIPAVVRMRTWWALAARMGRTFTVTEISIAYAGAIIVGGVALAAVGQTFLLTLNPYLPVQEHDQTVENMVWFATHVAALGVNPESHPSGQTWWAPFVPLPVIWCVYALLIWAPGLPWPPLLATKVRSRGRELPEVICDSRFRPEGNAVSKPSASSLSLASLFTLTTAVAVVIWVVMYAPILLCFLVIVALPAMLRLGVYLQTAERIKQTLTLTEILVGYVGASVLCTLALLSLSAALTGLVYIAAYVPPELELQPAAFFITLNVILPVLGCCCYFLLGELWQFSRSLCECLRPAAELSRANRASAESDLVDTCSSSVGARLCCCGQTGPSRTLRTQSYWA